MITADTITNEQIVALRNETFGTGDHELMATCHDAMPGSTRRVEESDGGEIRLISAADRRAARARCAEILNQRGAK